MKTAIPVLIVLLSLFISALAQASVPAGEDEAEILKLMGEINRAYVARVPEPLERIYLDSFVSIRGKPVYNAKEQLLAMVRADANDIKLGRTLDFETVSYDIESPNIRIFGDTAVVTVLKKNFWRYRESKCLTRYQSTDVWLRRDGKWQLAAGHSTVIQCKGAPWYPPHPALDGIPVRVKPTAEIGVDVEAAIRKILDELVELRAKPNGTVSDTVRRNFADRFVSTGEKGDVIDGRANVSATLRNGSSILQQFPREDEAFQPFGDTVVYTYRVKTDERAARTAQATFVFINIDGRWQIAASHVS